jgi:hypothetical protein
MALPKIIDLARQQAKYTKPSKADPIGAQANRTWLKHAFMIPFKTDPRTGKTEIMLADIDKRNMGFSSAFFKFTNSSMGGSLCINPPPQFTRYADPRVKGINPDARRMSVLHQKGSLGQGRQYSEMIDDNSQIIHLRFGVPSFNSLFQFFTGFYNGSLARLVRTGRVDQTFFEKVINAALTVIEIAILPLTILPMMIMAVGNAVRFFLRMPASKFYYLKPTMLTYWHTVTSLVNMMAVNQKLVTYTQPDMTEQFLNEKVTPKHIRSILQDLFPEMTERGVPDMYLIATKAKRLEMRQRENLFKQLSSSWEGKNAGPIDPSTEFTKSNPSETIPYSRKSVWERWMKSPVHGQALKSEIETDWREPAKKPETPAGTAEETIGDKVSSLADKAGNYISTIASEAQEQFTATSQDGAEWLSLRVDYTGSQTESFSTSTAPSSLAEKMNSASQSAREIRYNYAEGNLDSMGLVKGAIDGIAAVATQAADLLHIGGLAAFAGSSFVDIPEHVTDTQASIRSSSYSFKLISPHGNIISQFVHIYIPLMCMLAGALPRSVGKQAHTDPFLCELYDRGRTAVRLGVIDSLSITRGTSNLGFDKDGRAMAIDVSFTVKDLSTIVAVPMHNSLSLNPFEGIFDTDNKFVDYMTTLAAIPLYEFDYRLPILRRQLDTKIADLRSYFSVSRLALDLGGSAPAQLYAALFSYGTPKK